MRAGLPISVAGHAAVIAAGLIALPYAVDTTTADPAPMVPVELVTITDTTNIRAAEESERPEPVEEPEVAVEEPEPEPEPEQENEPAPPPPPEPEPEQSEPEPVPERPESEPEEAEPVPAEEEEEPEPEPDEPEPEPAPEEPEPEPEEEEDSFNLDRITSLVDKAREESPQRDEREDAGENPPEQAEQRRESAGLSSDLTMSEYDALRARMIECWRAPVDAPNPEELQVTVRVELNRDGTLAGQPRLQNQARINLSGDPYLKLAGERAIRAVQQCAPYSFLPEEKYSAWREIDMHFDPSEMMR